MNVLHFIRGHKKGHKRRLKNHEAENRPAKEEAQIIGGDKKLPLLKFVRDPIVSELLDLSVALQEMNAPDSIPPDSPSEALEGWKEWGEYMV